MLMSLYYLGVCSLNVTSKKAAGTQNSLISIFGLKIS